MPPSRATADDVDNAIAAWPTLSDLPESMHVNVIHTNFDLEGHLRKTLISSNLWVPPVGDRCPINDLPNELLSHIFWIGTFEEDEDEDEEDI